jgi:hypothetical protein
MKIKINFEVVLTNFFISLRHVRKAQGKMEGKRRAILPDHVHFCCHRNPYSLHFKVHHRLGGFFRPDLLALEIPPQTGCARIRLPGDHPGRFVLFRAVSFLLGIREEDTSVVWGFKKSKIKGQKSK